jgi:menaquinol-cytochrome c reductase iron-sulfur subunit
MADEPETELTRRRFLSRLVAGIGGAIAATVGIPVAGYFLSPEWKKRKNVAIAIAKVDEIPRGQPTFVRYEQRVPDAWITTTESKGAWVITSDGEHFNVYDPHCTHLGCPYYWDAERRLFQCPCHGGQFNIEGVVLAGPPPRPLDRYDYHIEDDEIVLTGRIIRGETSPP